MFQWLYRKLHRHRWAETIWNSHGIAVEERCRCGAVRHHLFKHFNGIGKEPSWQSGPHPHRERALVPLNHLD